MGQRIGGVINFSIDGVAYAVRGNTLPEPARMDPNNDAAKAYARQFITEAFKAYDDKADHVKREIDQLKRELAQVRSDQERTLEQATQPLQREINRLKEEAERLQRDNDSAKKRDALDLAATVKQQTEEATERYMARTLRSLEIDIDRPGDFTRRLQWVDKWMNDKFSARMDWIDEFSSAIGSAKKSARTVVIITVCGALLTALYKGLVAGILKQ